MSAATAGAVCALAGLLGFVVYLAALLTGDRAVASACRIMVICCFTPAACFDLVVGRPGLAGLDGFVVLSFTVEQLWLSSRRAAGKADR